MVILVKTWAASATFTQRLVRVPDYAKEETLETKAATDQATTRLKWAQLRNTMDLSLSVWWRVTSTDADNRQSHSRERRVHSMSNKLNPDRPFLNSHVKNGEVEYFTM